MASSSSSSPLMVSSSSSPRNWEYNVFTSFHGPDVRRTILSHLRKQFEENGITMFDDNGIERSQKIAPALTKAIKESRIAIVLLSKNYASSSWCLDELFEIMKCNEDIGQIVMTVFYEVDPSDVRKQTGDFGKAFNKTCDGKTEEQRQNWRQALNDVGNIAGYDFKTWDNEVKMIEEIARNVSDKLNVTPCKDFDDDKVGLENHLRKMESLLDLDNAEVKIVGISGPAGIGKSTIARALQNRLLSSKFQYNCFVDNLWECYKICRGEYGLKLRLHEQVFSKMLKQNGMEITHLGVMKNRLHDKKVLIILDDVESVAQLEALANIEWFGPGSRVIVTTENKEVLQQHRISDVYQVDFPSKSEALMIFCRSAFGKTSPPVEFMNLAYEVAEICGKLPLGLHVLGSSMRGKTPADWKDELPRLKRCLDGTIEGVLKVGYESLHKNDQALFLFIAIFFSHARDEHVTSMLAKKNFEVRLGLKNLAKRCLIHHENSEVVMHHLLQVMAIKVITEQKPSKTQILVDAKMINQVLLQSKEVINGSILGVLLRVAEANKLVINPRDYKRFHNLLFLKVSHNRWPLEKLYFPDNNENRDDIEFPEDIEFPRHIRLFHWDEYPGKRLPLSFCAENLVEFNMVNSKLEKLWEGKQKLGNLTKMNLHASFSLRELPDLSYATNLEKLDVTQCSALVELPSSFANLQKLKLLWTHSCESLEVIPTLINLTSLEWIAVMGCPRFRSLPDIPTSITQLEVTDTALEELPASFRHCSGLDEVILKENGNLKTFLTHLPTSVTIIDLSKSGIERITDCISGLHNLTHLTVTSCERLASLPDLPGSLRLLDADDCISLESVSDPLNTPFAELRFSNCIKLSRQARRAIIKRSFSYGWAFGWAFFPGRKVPKDFEHRGRGNSLTISDSTFNRFKVCVVMSPGESGNVQGISVSCFWSVIGNSVKSGCKDFTEEYVSNPLLLSTKHLLISYISLPLLDPYEVSRKIVLEFSSREKGFHIIRCGAQILKEETDGSNNERHGDEVDLSDTDESDREEEDDDNIETSECESDDAYNKEDDENRYKFESGEASNKEDDEDEYKSESGEASEEKDDYESVSRKRRRKTSVLMATAFSSQPMVPFTFPDSSATLDAPAPPPPTYGFHMLERRTITLTDGSVHSYLALPPNYQDSPPPFHPEEFQDHPERSMKRKYPEEDEIERAEMLRQSQQFMNYASPNDQSVAGTSSSPFLSDVGEDNRAAKHMRIGPC